jgi:RNA polymerase sigma-70 factor (ECF subfamily)
LQQLKPEVMEVLLMSYFKGLTYENIANTLKVPLNTIKTWVRRAMPILKKCLEDNNA